MNRLILLIFALPLFYACETEIVSDSQDFEDKMVVYGFINPLDSCYIIRVSRLHQGLGKDMNNYKNFDETRVWLELRDRNNRMVKRQEMEKGYECPNHTIEGHVLPYACFRLQKEAFDLEVLEPMPFPFIRAFNQFSVGLIIKDPYVKDSIYTDSPLLNELRIKYPYPLIHSFYFYSDFGRELIGWNLCGEKYQIIFTFHYYDLLENDTLKKSFSWTKFLEAEHLNTKDFYDKGVYIDPAEFYQQVALNIPDDPSVKHRQFSSFDFEVIAMDDEFANYIEYSRIMEDYGLSVHSNISNALGLFSVCSSDRRVGNWIGDQEMDTLAYGRQTKHLRFLPYRKISTSTE